MSKKIDKLTILGKQQIKIDKKRVIKLGEIVELDGSLHRWFNNKQTSLRFSCWSI